jgi:hypothetical protein
MAVRGILLFHSVSQSSGLYPSTFGRTCKTDQRNQAPTRGNALCSRTSSRRAKARLRQAWQRVKNESTPSILATDRDAEVLVTLLRNTREEVIGLLFNRHIFRTQREIARRNPRLQGRPLRIFSEWAQVVYAQAAAVGVRRVAAQRPEDGDVSLVRFLDGLIRDSNGLREALLQHYPEDAAKARQALHSNGPLQTGWEFLACKRLIGEDRRELISIADKTAHFANKRVAHSIPDEPVRVTFNDLDDAIDAVKRITEKYTQLFFSKKLRGLRRCILLAKTTGYTDTCSKCPRMPICSKK